MKVKVLRHKKIDCYGKYMGEGEIYSSSIPYVYPMTFSLERLAKYVEEIEGLKLETSNWEEVTVKVTEI